MKICSTCKLELDISLFYIDNKNKDKLGYVCKNCLKKYKQANKEKITKYKKKHYKENKEKISKYKKKYYKENKNNILQNVKKYSKENRERICKYWKKYSKENRQKITTNLRNRRKNDFKFKLLCTLRTRILTAIKNNYKSAHTIELLGCDIEQVRLHIESQFKGGMTWDNHGAKGWHIDHIKPCSSFDLSKPKEQKKCFHYTNLQPLWWYDNLAKGDKIQ